MAIGIWYEGLVEGRLKLIDSAENEYIFPKGFSIIDIPTQKRSSVVQVAYTHGAKDIGDGKIAERIIKITGKLWENTQTEFFITWSNIIRELSKENFQLEYFGKRINIIRTINIAEAFDERLWYPFSTIEFDCLAVDPFWYSVDKTIKQFTASSSPYFFSFTSIGNIESFPIIKVKNNANNFDFKIYNMSDAESYFRLQDSGATAGKEIIIDCKAGTVKRDGTDVIQYFSGEFIKVLGGRENQIKYEGANANIAIEYYEAYL